MNNTTLGNTSLLTFSDNTLKTDFSVELNLLALIVRLPVNVYIIQLIISRQRVTPELYTLNVAVFELLICIYDLLGVATFFSANAYLDLIRMFFLGFLITGRPSLLMLICVDRYLAVVKPVAFLRWKQLKYKMVLCGVVWVWTLLFSTVIVVGWAFHFAVLTHIVMCCTVKLYCCGATLLALKQPGPGEGAKQKEGMNEKKLKAFRIILMTAVTVIVMYVPLVIVLFLKNYLGRELFLKITNLCLTCTAFSGIVQSILFLQRFGKLPFIKCP